jgi:chorismate dehydratase
MGANKRLGVVDALYCRPLYQRLAKSDGFTALHDVPSAHAIGLRNHTLDVGFLTPIDYAREALKYRIIPDVGVASTHPTGSIGLFFRDAVHTLTSVAIDPSSLSEIVLARVILAEEFNLNPSFVPARGTLDEQLAKADAVLLVGDASLTGAEHHPNYLDLVESWIDLTDLPYVHGVWCAHDGDLTAAEVGRIQQIAQRGITSLVELADELQWSSTPPFASSRLFRTYWDAFSYSLSEEDLQGFGEFLRYAFYHGVLPEVAELSFFPTVETPPVDDAVLKN